MMPLGERFGVVTAAAAVDFESRNGLLTRFAAIDRRIDWGPACERARGFVIRGLEANEWLDADRRAQRPWWHLRRRRREEPPWSAVAALEDREQRGLGLGPPELEYVLSTEVADDGSIVAVIVRAAPDSRGEPTRHEAGYVRLGDDESALIATRFATLQDEVRELTAAARPAHARAVAAMRHQIMAEAMAFDRAAEHEAVNAGLVETLNRTAADT
jgi:hypothetical protein